MGSGTEREISCRLWPRIAAAILVDLDSIRKIALTFTELLKSKSPLIDLWGVVDKTLQHCLFSVNYQITHTTSTGEHHDGTNSGAYLFTLIGTAGETAQHDCSANRAKGVTAHCTFQDPAHIGKLKGMRVKNKSDNTWVFVSMSVQIDGVLKGRWQGTSTVPDYKTATINFEYLGRTMFSLTR